MGGERELWFVRPRRVEVRAAAPARELGQGEVRARALCSGISRGTELLLYRGEGPQRFDPSLDAPGAPLYPRRYGYSWVGEVVESRAETLAVGARVFALRPHGDQHILRPEDCRVLPATIPAARATLAASLETAMTVVWDAEIGLGDRVVVLGGGIVGLLSVMLARLGGAELVRLVERSDERRRAALALGGSAAVAPETDVPAGEADVVIEATGDPSCLDHAIAHAALEATVVVASFYGLRRSPLSLGDAFHRRRLRLVASQVSRLPACRMARWDAARRFASVVHHLHDERLDALIDPPVPLDDAPALYARLDQHPGLGLHGVFAYP